MPNTSNIVNECNSKNLLTVPHDGKYRYREAYSIQTVLQKPSQSSFVGLKK